jgi:FAD/FMN-containing dehydrogenase
VAAFAVVLALGAKPAIHLLRAAWRDVDAVVPLPASYVDDASRMNATHVGEVWPCPAKLDAAEGELAKLLRRARKEHLRVSIAGARHTMGGHTIVPDGIVVDMAALDFMRIGDDLKSLTVGAGARWSEVLEYLDPLRLSVGVMQSNNSFSVGGSISANCHGWQFGKPPIASTVDSFRLMQADGRVVRCSRQENKELFSLALGGYGLFGVILEVDLRVVPNERYRLEQVVVPIGDAMQVFRQRIAGQPDVAMAYGRLEIVPTRFLDEAIINILHRDPAPDGALDPLKTAESAGLRRSLFRGSADSDYGKELRWSAEARLQPHLNHTHFTRNQLLNEGVEVFQNRSAEATDILHEYFLPLDSVAAFIASARQIIPAHRGNLLNVTVRAVEADDDAFLRYADQPMIAFVMLFNQSATGAGDAQMETLTRELIDAALSAGGRYYLPYRLHATPQQFRRAYPMAGRFWELKRKYDPEGIFQNRFYQRYAR